MERPGSNLRAPHPRDPRYGEFVAKVTAKFNSLDPVGKALFTQPSSGYPRMAALMGAGVVSHEDSTNLYYIFMVTPPEVQAANPFRTWDWQA